MQGLGSDGHSRGPEASARKFHGVVTEAVAVPPPPLVSPSVLSATGWKEAELETFSNSVRLSCEIGCHRRFLAQSLKRVLEVLGKEQCTKSC